MTKVFASSRVHTRSDRGKTPAWVDRYIVCGLVSGGRAAFRRLNSSTTGELWFPDASDVCRIGSSANLKTLAAPVFPAPKKLAQIGDVFFYELMSFLFFPAKRQTPPKPVELPKIGSTVEQDLPMTLLEETF